MKTWTFTCSMNWIEGSGIVKAPTLERALELVNQLPDLKIPITEEDLDIVSLKVEGVILITNGDY